MTTIPTISQLYDQTIADINAEFGTNINPVGKAFLRAFAAVVAALRKIDYLVLGAVQKNIYLDTCDEETLLRHGKIKLNRLPFQPVAGKYKLEVTGSTGATIPAGTLFKSNDTAFNPGIIYQVDSDYTLAASTDFILVRCLTLGPAGKLDVNDTLTCTVPLPLVDKLATVTEEDVQPLAGESIEDYRKKVMLSNRLEPQGGSPGDYRIWAADAQGVRTVYPYPKFNAPSWVSLFIEANPGDSLDGKGTPTAQIIADVEDVVNFNPDNSLSLNERGRRPTQVFVEYLPVTPLNVVINIASYQNLTVDIQNLITDALGQLVNSIRPYVAGADILSDKNDILDTNQIIGTIITAKPGSVFGSVTFTVSGSPESSYQFQGGNIPYLLSVNFI